MDNSQENRVCAYCGGAELTREHLIPKGYFERMGDAKEFVGNIKAGKADKIVSVEPAIADYAIKSGDRILLQFSFDELLRWLLKMGYNMGRARQWPDVGKLASTIRYIRFNQNRPDNAHLLLQLTKPGNVGDDAHASELLPHMFIVNALREPKTVISLFDFVLHVGIHCYQFFVLFHNPTSNIAEGRKRPKQFQRIFRGAYEIEPSESKVTLYPSSITLWEMLNGPLLNAGFRQHMNHYFRGKLRLRTPNS